MGHALASTSKISEIREAGSAGKQFDFGKLVNTIMQNPFSASGLNTSQAYAKASLRPGQSVTRKGRPCRDNSQRIRGKVNEERYK